ncbi:TNT domain-containing protein [Kitasatospora sp. NPDC059803]|uniref:TNT domain-containing protein n=1 Tax=Kitasatospora sp. NPDC059803 TaxID=3346953 RepID=UPI003664C186
MRVRTMLAASLACALPITGLTAAGGAAAAQPVNAQPVNAQSVRAVAVVPDDCPPPPDATESPMAGKYYCSQERFGPAAIPNDEPAATLLRGYQRFGGLSASHFVQLYYDATDKRWAYAPDRGFQRLDGKLDQTVYTVPIGTKLIRFGDITKGGGYLADPGTPFVQMAVTPDALNGGYHCLSAEKEFRVQKGHVAAFYGMPGGDVQEWLDPALAPSGLEGGYKVNNLIAKGYLSELQAEQCNVAPTGS